MKKLFNSFLILLLTAGSAGAADPAYEIGSGSIMSSPPAIGAVAPNTGKFTTLDATMGFKVVGHSSLDSADFVGNIHTSNASTATFDGPVIIKGAFNYVGQVQGTADNINIGQVAPGKGNFTTLEATGGITGALTGNASTAAALAANGANCSAGQYPKGVDASGAVESCTAVTLTTDVTGVLPAANGGVPTTTKGDLAGHNGTSNVRIPVGTNGQVLTADSTQSLGLAWATAGASANNTYGFISVSHSSTGPSTNIASPGAWADEITITPQSSSNKVYLNVSAAIYGDANTNCGLMLRRSVGGTYTDLVFNNRVINGQAAGTGAWASINYLDSPSTISQIKYSLWVYKLAGSNNCYISPGGSDYTIISVAEVAP